MDFGIVLKKLRQDKNLTQEELAQKLETSRSNIANYENGKNMPSLEILSRLSEIFDCSIDFLLGKSKNIDLNEIDLAFSSGIKALNDTNKMIIKNTMEALLAKQEKDENKK